MSSNISYFFKYHFLWHTRNFLSGLFRKYVRHHDYWTENSLSNRSERQNKHFRWTEKNVRKLNELNDFLSGEMKLLYEECLETKNQFDEWISQGKDYYRNYEIKGHVICVSLDDEGRKTRKSNLHEAQEDALKEDSWCIRFSNNLKSPVDEDMETQLIREYYMDPPLIEELKEHGIEKPCVALQYFLDESHGYSLKDFVKMNKENFYRTMEVNYV